MAELRQSDVKPALLRRVRHVVVKIGLVAARESRRPRHRGAVATRRRHRGDRCARHRRDGRQLGRGRRRTHDPRLVPRRRRSPSKQAAAAVGQIRLMAEWQKAFAAHGIVVAQVLLDARRPRQPPPLSQRRAHARDAARAPRAADRQRERHRRGRRAQVRRQRQPLGAGREPRRRRPAGHPERRRRPLHRESRDRSRRAPHPARRARRYRDAGSRERRQCARHRRHGARSSPPPEGRGGRASRRSSRTAARRERWPRSSTRAATSARCSGRSPTGSRAASTGSRSPLKPRARCTATPAPSRALSSRGRSLLPSGVTDVSGRFGVGDCVRLVGPDGQEFARGLVSYRAGEAARITGRTKQRGRADPRLQDGRRDHPPRRPGGHGRRARRSRRGALRVTRRTAARKCQKGRS